MIGIVVERGNIYDIVGRLESIIWLLVFIFSILVEIVDKGKDSYYNMITCK